MTDTAAETRDKKHRSPAYPFISLPKAIARAEAFYTREKRHAAPVNAALRHWEFSEKSSGGQQTVGALKHYGLLVDEGGSGADRRIKLTDRAFRILLDEVQGSPDRTTAIREAALAPKLFAEMFQQWGVDLPSDETIRTYLRRDKGFNDDVLATVLKAYKETLQYGGWAKSDKVDHKNRDDNSIAEGDYVQWESMGVLQFEAKKVTGVHNLDDGNFVTVEGSQTGIPMEEVTKVDPPIAHVMGAHIPSGARVPNATALAVAAGIVGTTIAPSRHPLSIAREVSYLVEGEAVLQWPATLSAESVEDLEAWLALVIKKLKRRVAG